MNAIETINKYLPGLNVTERALKNQFKVPALYRALYNFEELVIDQYQFLLITVKDKKVGPRDLKKHAEILKTQSRYPLIWFFQEMHFHKVQRMIENGFNFVVQNKQVYLPSLNISIKAERMQFKPELTHLNSHAINLIEWEILENNLTGKNKTEIANLLQMNLMTAGRALEPLINLDLCFEEKRGVSKVLRFRERAELWEYFKNNIDSPVEKIVYLKKEIPELPFSGITALSKTSMLAEDKFNTYCVSKKRYNAEFSNVNLTESDLAVSRLEIWNREPLLIEGNKHINVLDLFLVLKSMKDERVKIELERLLKEMDLKYD